MGLEVGALMLFENLVDAHLQLIQAEKFGDIGTFFQSLYGGVHRGVT
jgi:hypothetical protein